MSRASRLLDNPSPSDHDGTVAHLECLMHMLVRVYNEGDYDYESFEGRLIAQHISPNWHGELDLQPKRVTWTEQKAIWKARAIRFPNIMFEARDVTTELNQRRGTAVVHMNFEVSGFGDHRVQAVDESVWVRRRDGRWMCEYMVCMRGSPGGDMHS